jgi:hypothetical protein
VTDPSAVAAYRTALAVAGVAVTVQRVAGVTPNVTTFAAAAVTAVVRLVVSDANAVSHAGLSASMMGAIDQADRLVILLADDLAVAGFPLPVANGDQIVLPESTEILNVTRVDPYKRALAGAIELYATGVS